jgi:lysophospholipase L1-like esterase
MKNGPLPLRLGACLVSGGIAVACGGGGSPTGPTPTPTPEPGYTVNVTVFYDENGNGQLDPSEAVRIPGVSVVVGTGTGTTAAGSGVAVVTGVGAGAQTVNLRTDSLPAYFQPGNPVPVQVPGTADVRYPLTLPIGQNNANVYFGYGDSITYGNGSSDGQGYRLRLLNLLGPYFGRADVKTFGRPGTYSSDGASRLKLWMGHYDPAYLLLLYGTNDWNDQTCQNQGPAACFTIDALRAMVEDAKDADTLPVLATLIPANPTLAPAGRNAWYDDMNVRIKALAQEQRVTLADLNAEFKAAGNLGALYSDDVHPNDAGYQVMAQGWFKAITRARSAAASSSPRFGFAFRR